MSDFVLYNYFRSSTSYRARIALELKQIKYEYVPIHLVKQEQHQAPYAELNPSHEVPTLIHQGMAIGQSMAIIEYLDEIHPTPKLFHGTPHLRAKIRQFCETINSFTSARNKRRLGYSIGCARDLNRWRLKSTEPPGPFVSTINCRRLRSSWFRRFSPLAALK
jgi:glutathione S-transferase